MIKGGKLKKLYTQQMMSMTAIARQMDVSRSTIKYWLEKYNIPTRTASESAYYTYWGIRKNSSGLGKITVEAIKKYYYQKGYSAKKIGELFGKSSSSIYGFMKRNNLARRSPTESNQINYEKQKPSFSLKQNLNSKEKRLKTAGIMLYWGEGAKFNPKSGGNRTVDFANSDPRMIRLFLKFLREICGIDEKRLRAFIYCYANQDVEKLKNCWQEITKIPEEQFTKPYIRKDFLLEKQGKMKYGLIHIRYNDKKMLLQIRDWIDKHLEENSIIVG